ncbi:unnamed protein product [Urochloa humidicola]
MEESGDHSRRRSHRRRTAAPVSVDPITEEEFHFEALSRRRRRRRRSGTRSQSQASSSAAPPVGGGAADPEPPSRPRRLTRLDPADGDGSLRGPFTRKSANDLVLWLADNPNWPSSSSAAPHPDRPGDEGRTHVRQSVLYSDRPRHSRFRRQEWAQEHATALSSTEFRSPVLNLPTSESLPLSDPPHSIPETAQEIYDDRPGAEGRTHVRHSVLYSDRPRHSQFRRQERAQEHAAALSSTEFHSPVLNLPTSEALPLSDPPHSTPES